MGSSVSRVDEVEAQVANYIYIYTHKENSIKILNGIRKNHET